MRTKLPPAAVSLLAGLALCLPVSLGAQAKLVKDINTVTTPPSAFGSRPDFPMATYQPTHVDGRGFVLFAAQSDTVGEELFSTIGLPGATGLVKDINPGLASSRPSSFFSMGNTTYFYATTAKEGRELWKTDGSLGGTVLVKDILPGESGAAVGRDASDFFDHGHGSMAALGSTLFLVLDGAGGLYKSDGTAAGTVLVKQLTPLPAHRGIDRPNVYLGSPTYSEVERRLVAIGNTLYFGADDGSNGGFELWRSDGTAAGTMMVKDINPGSGDSDPTGFFDYQGKLYFRADDGTNGVELWMSDGTTAGTVLVRDIYPGSGSSIPAIMTLVGSTMFFRANDGSTGEELWKSDGTSAGTTQVVDIASASSFPTGFTPFGKLLLFGASDTGSVSNFDLWVTDGTSSGTLKIKDNPYNYVFQSLVYKNKVFFQAYDTTTGSELWTTDGTAQGTALIKDIWPGSSPGYYSDGPHYLTPSPFGVVFFTNDGQNGLEPWVSDGTAQGTTLLADVFPPNPLATDGSGPTASISSGGTWYARVFDGVNGSELWKSDGTSAGTVMVKDINPGAATGNPYNFTTLNGTVFFTATDGVNGTELWKTDGTSAGTLMVKDINPGSGNGVTGLGCWTTLQNLLLLAGDDGQNGWELWKSDGTAKGTVMVKDINPGSGNGAGGTWGIRAVTVGNVAFFHADDGTNGWELWKTDGTTAGTVMVKDINPAGDSLASRTTGQHKVAVGNLLFFSADDGKTGLELWKSDGTAAGTVLVKDINPGPASSGNGATTWTTMEAVGNQAYFYADDGTHGFELWKSDGTTAGTVMVADLNPGAAGFKGYYGNAGSDFFAKEIIAFGNGVLFGGDDGKNGIELWKTDGTAKGTVLVKDIEPGAGGSDCKTFRRFGSRYVYFTATTSANGREVWRTDGTTAGTVIVADIAPGSGNGWDYDTTGSIHLVNGKILLVANDGVKGDELWSISIGATAQQVGFEDRLGIYWSAIGGFPVKNGAGCSKNGLAPLLDGTDPVLGQTASLNISRADSNQKGLLALGLTAAGPFTLPPYCAMWVNLTTPPPVLLAFTTDASGNYATGNFKVPNDLRLLGAVFGSQAVINGPNGMPSLGFAVTNGLFLAPGF